MAKEEQGLAGGLLCTFTQFGSAVSAPSDCVPASCICSGWKAPLNAFQIAFEGRLTPTSH